MSVETSLYVDQDYKRQGIGYKLYAALLERLSSIGVHTAIGIIGNDNDASIRLHEKFGFECVGRFREIGCKFDRILDVEMWQIFFPFNPLKQD